MAVYRDTQTGDVVEERPVTTERQEYGMNVVARVIYFIGSVIVILLALRFLLALLGANPANGFADFIYSVTRPLVSPFTTLFSYSPTLGRSHFELTTLVAIVVYGLIAVLLARLVTLGSRRPA